VHIIQWTHLIFLNLKFIPLFNFQLLWLQAHYLKILSPVKFTFGLILKSTVSQTNMKLGFYYTIVKWTIGLNGKFLHFSNEKSIIFLNIFTIFNQLYNFHYLLLPSPNVSQAFQFQPCKNFLICLRHPFENAKTFRFTQYITGSNIYVHIKPTHVTLNIHGVAFLGIATYIENVYAYIPSCFNAWFLLHRVHNFTPSAESGASNIQAHFTRM
jgi:hypothetical protein